MWVRPPWWQLEHTEGGSGQNDDLDKGADWLLLQKLLASQLALANHSFFHVVSPPQTLPPKLTSDKSFKNWDLMQTN